MQNLLLVLKWMFSHEVNLWNTSPTPTLPLRLKQTSPQVQWYLLGQFSHKHFAVRRGTVSQATAGCGGNQTQEISSCMKVRDDRIVVVLQFFTASSAEIQQARSVEFYKFAESLECWVRQIEKSKPIKKAMCLVASFCFRRQKIYSFIGGGSWHTSWKRPELHVTESTFNLQCKK